MVVTKRKIDVCPDWHQWILLSGDWHVGNPDTDYGRLREELQEAKVRNALITANGDIFDALTAKHPYYLPTGVHKRLVERTDGMEGALDWALELCDPVKDNLAIIGLGNHDLWCARNGFDPVLRLVKTLRRDGSGVEYGDIEGALRLSFVSPPRTYWSADIWRHHGAGGNSPVTKGITDFSRMWPRLPDAKIIQLGHKHNRFIDTMRRTRWTADGNVYGEDCLSVMAGAYMEPHKSMTSDDILTRGRRSNYATDGNMAPQSMGGVWVKLSPRSSKGGPIDVTVELSLS